MTQDPWAELREAAKAATPGEWEAEPGASRGAWIKGYASEWTALACGDNDASAARNARYIVLAQPRNVLSLLDDRDQLSAANERMGRLGLIVERERDAAVAERDQQAEEIERLRTALRQAEDWFRDYDRQHRAKCTAEEDHKATTNRQRADFLAQALEGSDHD